MLPSSPRRAFLFDMDGTLVDNMAWHVRTWFQIFEELGIVMSEDAFHQRLAGRTNEAIYRQLLGESLDPAEATRLGMAKEARYRALYAPELRPLPGLERFLADCTQAGILCAVATSADPPNVAFVLDGCALRRHFPVVVHGQDVTRHKPEPETFLCAAERLGVDPADCIVFEDSRSGLEAARRAGMPAVGLCTSLDAATVAAFPGVIAAWSDYRGRDPLVLDAAPVAG